MRIKDVVIIGAGVSGLAAGIYAEQHGLHAIILEKNPTVGGLCTGWYRKGHYLDGCIHWLTGTKDGCDLNRMWKNVHAFESDEDIVHLPSFGTFEYEGVEVPFYSDVDKAEQVWTEISPVDKRQIHHFFNKVRDFMKVSSPVTTPVGKMNIFKLLAYGLRVLSVFPSYLMTMKMDNYKYARKFKHPALRNAIDKIQGGRGNLFQVIYSYAAIASGNGGVPVGGSVKMIDNMKDYFLSLGGTIKTNSPVKDVIIENKNVTGVVLENGRIYECDYLIPACDSFYFLHNILKDQYPREKFYKNLFNAKKNPTPSSTLVFLNLKKDIKKDFIYHFECEPFMVGEQKVTGIHMRDFSYDETISQKGNSVVSILLNQFQEDYDYWKALQVKDRNAYRLEKQRVADDVISRIIKRFPELEGNIELLDISTPVTLTRYTNNYKGAYMSFAFTSKNSMYWDSGRIKGLHNVFMASQWMASPGGLPFALATGTWAVQKVCAKENIRYLLGDKPSLSLSKKSY